MNSNQRTMFRSVHMLKAPSFISTSFVIISLMSLPCSAHASALLHWDFEGQGNVIEDRSGNNNNLELVGGSRVLDDDASRGQVLRLAEEHPTLKQTLNIDQQSKNFTVSFWIKPRSNSSYNQKIGFGWNRFQFHSTKTNGIFIGITKDERFKPRDINHRLELGVWHHVAFTANEQTASLYINGELTSSKAIQVATQDWQNFILSKIDGSIDDVMLFQSTLNAEQISSLYNGSEISNDQDGDGILDQDDQWPNDASMPKKSTLWGAYGEQWDTQPKIKGIQSRLPFFALAGYRDGATPPRPQCSLNVTQFGAKPNDGVDDTNAFWQALTEARKTASKDNLTTICLNAGVYNLRKQLHLNQSGMILRGAGRDATVLNFKRGMIGQTYSGFIGSVDKNWSANKAVVLGDGGLAWKDAVQLSELQDLSKLPKVGDLEITLPAPLSVLQLQQLQDTGYRIRLMESSHYSNREVELRSPIFTAGAYGGPEALERVAQQIESGTFEHQYNEFTPMKFLSGYDTYTQGHYNEYKYGNGHEPLYQQFVVRYTPGTTVMHLDRPVRFDMTFEHRSKRPKLQMVNSAVTLDTDIAIENLTIKFPATTWKSCEGALPGYACTTGLATHNGYWAQGGIDILSDFSWVRNVGFMNAGNPIKVSGDFNTITGLMIDSVRPTTEAASHAESPYDIEKYSKTSVVGHVGVRMSGIDNFFDDIVLRANFMHSLSMGSTQGVVINNARAEQPAAHPTDNAGREYVKINMDHHRQMIHATLWSNINLGGSYRMWHSTGDITEGFSAAAYNTYWGIDSTSPSVDYWPHNRKGAIEWGYHHMNVVGSNVQQKPPAPKHTSITDLPYPYANRNPELNPFPYHPDNAHLEAMAPKDLWPKNLYKAQRAAYFECRLAIKPNSCE